MRTRLFKDILHHPQAFDDGVEECDQMGHDDVVVMQHAIAVRISRAQGVQLPLDHPDQPAADDLPLAKLAGVAGRGVVLLASCHAQSKTPRQGQRKLRSC